MKIALVGSSGYISHFIIDRLGKDNEIIRIDRQGDVDHVVDLEKADIFDYDVLNDVGYVIFPAAISSPDLCEKEYDTCWRINVEGTSYFIEEALKRGCRTLFFSSDAVFGDHPDEVFDEESETAASTAYGKMKKAVEDRFKDDDNFKAIRLSYVVSRQDKFSRYVLICAEKNEVCEVYDPFCRNCITINDVLTCIEYLINNWEDYPHTFLNIAGKDLVSREDIVKELKDKLNLDLEYKVVYPGNEFYSCRPKITRMTSRYLSEYGILPDESFSEKMEKELKGE
ncbi:MAG: sugar nucleotide-binding protein [Erysipelotrichaceae bacterium]|nr:sugar nucleotide-binding protein [Erysipelotrichaceae bacterium]